MPKKEYVKPGDKVLKDPYDKVNRSTRPGQEKATAKKVNPDGSVTTKDKLGKVRRQDDPSKA